MVIIRNSTLELKLPPPQVMTERSLFWQPVQSRGARDALSRDWNSAPEYYLDSGYCSSLRLDASSSNESGQTRIHCVDVCL